MPYLRTSVTKNPVFDDATRGLASQQAFGNRQNAMTGLQGTFGWMGGGASQPAFSTPQTPQMGGVGGGGMAAPSQQPNQSQLMQWLSAVGKRPMNPRTAYTASLALQAMQGGASPGAGPAQPGVAGPVTDQSYTAYGGYNQPTQGLPGLQTAPTQQMGSPMFSAAEMNALAMQANQAQRRGAEHGLTTLLGYEPQAQRAQLQREDLAAQEESALGDIYNQMANQKNLYDLAKQRHELANQARTNTWLAMLTNMLGG